MAKIRKFRYFPVELAFAPTYEDCEVEGKKYAEREGAYVVHPYDDWRTVAGQGTIGLEIREVLPELDAVVVPVGGGGMISGIAIALRSIDPEIKIIAAQSAASPALSRSLQDQRCYEVFPVEHSIAEGLAGGIGKIVYQLAPTHIDEIINVDEDRIRTVISQFVIHEQMLVEPSGAVSIASLEQIESVPRGSRIAAVVSGGNLDVRLLRSILERESI
jgi:threonine dehydratase